MFVPLKRIIRLHSQQKNFSTELDQGVVFLIMINSYYFNLKRNAATTIRITKCASPAWWL